jgi:hypothetical protein
LPALILKLKVYICTYTLYPFGWKVPFVRKLTSLMPYYWTSFPQFLRKVLLNMKKNISSSEHACIQGKIVGTKRDINLILFNWIAPNSPALEPGRPGVNVMITIFCGFRQFSANNWHFSQKPLLWSNFYTI